MGSTARDVEHAVNAVIVEVLGGHKVCLADDAIGSERLLLPLGYCQGAREDLRELLQYVTDFQSVTICH